MRKSTKSSKLAKHRHSVWIHGYSGRMGQEILKALTAAEDNFIFVGGSAETFYDDESVGATAAMIASKLSGGAADLIIDFSAPAANKTLLMALSQRSRESSAVLIGTTGLSSKQKSSWTALAKKRELRVLLAPNTSLGVIATLQAARLLERATRGRAFDIEIVETHHRRKKDAPSGTALFLAEGIASESGGSVKCGRTGERKAEEIGVTSVRGGGVCGEHEVRFLAEHEEVSITHRAFDRSLFASGALFLGEWLLRQKPGSYGLLDVKF